MSCPICYLGLERALFNNVEIDYCPKCLGIWFEQDELRWAKDEKDENIKWLDIDLWENKDQFRIAPGQKLCPLCRLPLYEVRYGDKIHPVKSREAGISPEAKSFNRVNVDVCNICHGIWLDKGEFRRIVDYLKKEVGERVMHDFSKNVAEEFLEIFSGPESLREEIEDFIILLKLFSYKFLGQHPLIAKLISQLPR